MELALTISIPHIHFGIDSIGLIYYYMASLVKRQLVTLRVIIGYDQAIALG
ncbi:hypothetical protein U9R62_10995 [Cylindrospermopsis raciborskii DSH]|uniref:hypothetical protein n=1 Tax=Cylindrospermopsis raciborskii TaxID=77022 RepID=UPI002ED9696A